MSEEQEGGNLSLALRSLDAALKAHMQTLEGALDDVNAKQPPPAPVKQEPVPKPNVLTRRNTKPAEGEVVNPNLTRNEKVPVTIQVTFMKIGQIDTIHDRYSGDVMIKAKWREPLFDGKKLDADNIEWDQYWNPKLAIENTIGEPKETVYYSLAYDHNMQATVCETKRVVGSFFEFMELMQFPFDSQDLTATVVSERSVTEIEFTEGDKSGINNRAFSAEQEWLLQSELNIWKKTVKKVVQRVTYKYPGYCVAAKVSRRPQFFIWNIILVMCVICSMTFATFSVKLNQPQFRLQLTFILLLTTVTFKFVVNKSLPRISYLTYLDKYILGSMIVLCWVCVWHALAGSVVLNNTLNSTKVATNVTTTPSCPFTPSVPDPSNIATIIDQVALGVLSSAYIGLHLVFVVLIACTANGETAGGGEDEDDDEPDQPDQPDQPDAVQNGNATNGGVPKIGQH